MIPFHFEYHKPSAISQALSLYQTLHAQEKEPLYYCGGTEIITMARLNQIHTKAVIDIKGIPECTAFEWEDDQLIIGAAVTLARLEEEKGFPLLSRTCNRIADHTSRCKITFGGNICGKIMYREAVLPVLLADSEVVIASEAGMKRVPIHEVFQEQLRLTPGDFLVQIITRKQYADAPYASEKRTKIDRIDYPLVTVAALRDSDFIRLALSGLCSFPFRSPRMEQEINAKGIPLDERINRALQHLPARIVDDCQGSAKYREFVLRNTLRDVVRTLEGAE